MSATSPSIHPAAGAEADRLISAAELRESSLGDLRAYRQALAGWIQRGKMDTEKPATPRWIREREARLGAVDQEIARRHPPRGAGAHADRPADFDSPDDLLIDSMEGGPNGRRSRYGYRYQGSGL